MPLFNRKTKQELLLHKPGDVVSVSLNYIIKNQELLKLIRNSPILILNIIKKEVVDFSFGYPSLMSYYVYEALVGSTKIEISDDDIIN